MPTKLTEFSNNLDFRKALTMTKPKGIWFVMTDYHLSFIIAVVSLAISAMSKTATLFLLRYFADLLSAKNVSSVEQNTHAFILIGLSFVALATIEGGFAYVSGRLSAYTAEGITRRLRNFLFDHIQRLSFSYHSHTSTGDLIERVTSDIDALRRFFSEQAIGIGRIFILFFINWIAIINLNVKLGLISVISIPPILLISLWFFKKVTLAFEKYQEQEAILSTTLQENLTGVRVVKAFARQEFEKDKFERENWDKFLKGKILLLMHSLFWPLSDIILGFQMLGGFIFAGTLVINQEITIGAYLAYVGLVVWLIWPIRNLGRLIVQTSTGLVSYARILEIVKQEREDLESGIRISPSQVQGKIEFKDVFFRYKDDEASILTNISFSIDPGQSLAIIGSTGSGKTTLMNLLLRFYDYSSGQIFLDGIELRKYSRSFLREQIGIVEQEPFLFSRSILENISYSSGIRVEQYQIEAAAKAAAIHDVIEKFPDGYMTVVGEKGVTLSGGQKQRITIARTLLKNPKILILDDSTSSVDAETEAEIREALNGLMKQRTTIIIAHRIQSVINADLILVLNKGKIVQRGKHEDLLLEKEGIYRQIFDIQARFDEGYQ